MPKPIVLVLVLGAFAVACSSSFGIPTPVTTPTRALPVETPTPEAAESPTPVFSSDPFNDGMIARRNGDYRRAIAAFQRVLDSSPSPDLEREARYRLGEAYWLYGDYPRAINTLLAYVQGNPNGARVPEARYLLGDAYRASKDYANAIEQWRWYREHSPTLAGDTDARIADVFVLLGDTTTALAQYDRALQDTTLTNSARVSILQRAADVHTGRGEHALAAARYDAALAHTADARTRADLLWRAGEAYARANQLDTAIARWKEAITKYPEQSGAYQSLVQLVNRQIAVDEFQRGLVDFHAGAYDAAIAAFRRHLQNPGTARDGDARYYIAQAYARQGAYDKAIAEYDVLIKTLPKDKRVPEAYLGKAAAFAAIGKVDDAVTTYRQLATTLADDPLADDALWRAAVLLDRANRYRDAARVYEELHTKYPARERAAEALFWAGFAHYQNKDYATARARWQSVVKQYPQSSFYVRALFWLGKIAQGQGQVAEAKNYWSQVAALNNGYYSWRAQELLTPSKPNVSYDLTRYAMGTAQDRAELEKWLATWSKGESPVTATLDATTRNDVRFRRGAELLRLARTVEARREFVALIESRKNDPRALYALAVYFYDNNLFSLTLDCAEKIARLATEANAPPAPRLLWMWRYPTAYADLVVAEAQANKIDPLLYFALIRQESKFNPWATSSADARGLAQVIPSTGREIAQRLKVTNFTLDQLYLPYISVRFGVWYFAQQLQTFGEPLYALIAYNAGASRVKQWQQADLDYTIEEIELTETATYVRIVYNNWKQYQWIYK
ncbi:MAG: tetratricopeptide repeat protein [Anaerolineae bacterium]|nr:tetratricopeptide repeat protein [Anaerolineae bacterium]